MGRCVYTPSRAVATAYGHFEGEGFEWENLLCDLSAAISGRYPSFRPAAGWRDREGRIILRSRTCSVVVGEYCGCLSVSLVVDDDGEYRALSHSWAGQISRNWQRLVESTLPNPMWRVGVMSNGEAVYQRVKP